MSSTTRIIGAGLDGGGTYLQAIEHGQDGTAVLHAYIGSTEHYTLPLTLLCTDAAQPTWWDDCALASAAEPEASWNIDANDLDPEGKLAVSNLDADDTYTLYGVGASSENLA
jgi:hypothetical protein